jgi:hypothetical protein
MDASKGGRAINVKRLRSLGIPETMDKAIFAQMRKHVTEEKGLIGTKVKSLNIESWDDVDAKNTFINAIDRWSRRVVQENDPGAMPGFMTSEMGKTIFQFRSFMIGAYTKMTLSGLHHRDTEAAVMALSTMFFGGLFYVGQTHVNSWGRPDRKEFLSKRLGLKEIGAAAFQRAGWSSVLPMISDSILKAGGLDPVFDYRASGQGTAIWENPTTDLLTKAAKAVSGVTAAAVNPNYDYSKQDFVALTSTLFMQNAFGIRNGLSVLGGLLPTSSTGN